MYCRKCGAEIPDNSKYCVKCGETVEIPAGSKGGVPEETTGTVEGEMHTVPEMTYTETNGKNYRKIGMITAGVIVVIAALIVCLIAFGGRSYREVVNEFFESAVVDPDADDLLELYPREYVREEMGYFADEDSLSDVMEYYLESETNSLRGGAKGKVRVDYDIVHNEKYDDDQLESVRTQLYNKYGISPSEARSITVSYVVKPRGGSESSDSIEMQLIKLGRSWYLISFSAADLSNLL